MLDRRLELDEGERRRPVNTDTDRSIRWRHVCYAVRVHALPSPLRTARCKRARNTQRLIGCTLLKAFAVWVALSSKHLLLAQYGMLRMVISTYVGLDSAVPIATLFGVGRPSYLRNLVLLFLGASEISS